MNVLGPKNLAKFFWEISTHSTSVNYKVKQFKIWSRFYTYNYLLKLILWNIQFLKTWESAFILLILRHMLLEENEQEAISMIIFWFQIFEMRLIMTNSTKQKTKTLYFVSNIFKIMSTLVLHLMTMMRRQLESLIRNKNTKNSIVTNMKWKGTECDAT